MAGRTEVEGWARFEHTADGRTHAAYRRGDGPGVVVIHELPGITPPLVAFAEEVVAAGFTVVMPSLFGRPGRELSGREVVRTLGRLCVNREFTFLAMNRTAPVATWLRSLARWLHEEVGGPGVGVVGMCFTGGYALAMLADAPVAAPVLAQPHNPFPIGRARSAAVDLGPEDLARVRQKVVDGCPVLGLKYADDSAVGTRFDTLREHLGEGFLAVELAGPGVSTLTNDRHPQAVEAVLAFFNERLRSA